MFNQIQFKTIIIKLYPIVKVERQITNSQYIMYKHKNKEIQKQRGKQRDKQRLRHKQRYQKPQKYQHQQCNNLKITNSSSINISNPNTSKNLQSLTSNTNQHNTHIMNNNINNNTNINTNTNTNTRTKKTVNQFKALYQMTKKRRLRNQEELANYVYPQYLDIQKQRDNYKQLHRQVQKQKVVLKQTQMQRQISKYIKKQKQQTDSLDQIKITPSKNNEQDQHHNQKQEHPYKQKQLKNPLNNSNIGPEPQPSPYNAHQSYNRKKISHNRSQSCPFMNPFFNGSCSTPVRVEVRQEKCPNYCSKFVMQNQSKRTLKKSSTMHRKNKRADHKYSIGHFSQLSQQSNTVIVHSLPLEHLSSMLYCLNDKQKQRKLKKLGSSSDLHCPQPLFSIHSDLYFQTRLQQQMKMYDLSEELRLLHRESENVKIRQQVLEGLARRFEVGEEIGEEFEDSLLIH